MCLEEKGVECWCGTEMEVEREEMFVQRERFCVDEGGKEKAGAMEAGALVNSGRMNSGSLVKNIRTIVSPVSRTAGRQK